VSCTRTHPGRYLSRRLLVDAMEGGGMGGARGEQQRLKRASVPYATRLIKNHELAS
jgi:hypothetical protein